MKVSVFIMGEIIMDPRLLHHGREVTCDFEIGKQSPWLLRTIGSDLAIAAAMQTNQD